MSSLNKAQPPVKSESTTIVVGVVHHAPPDPYKVASSFASTSYTVSDRPAEGSPSQPLSVDAVGVVNSVLGGVRESAVRRDGSEDF
jgi:hypothetical protein